MTFDAGSKGRRSHRLVFWNAREAPDPHGRPNRLPSTLHARLLHEPKVIVRSLSRKRLALEALCRCHLPGAAEELGEAPEAPECSGLHGSERNA